MAFEVLETAKGTATMGTGLVGDGVTRATPLGRVLL